ncbi:UDP-N-acetylmuramyl peptide synthase [Virgibacillus indicus]|uniref:UDP-N-acetylmuramyl peptide synthase n=1 Tax=Virgibacillus indicus TaxID=2024554 RepID=A0A265NB30_9BACI|nr:UDP-N-acetylmuramyl-tripeptide synthetase [Virgibacillus indicus]OZU89250.1 UDP-N-acetylmuramyl peptide synthase [Virgibacillus indicus]
MKLSQLLTSLHIENKVEYEDLEIQGVSYHSQKAEPGHLFVCIKGYKTDGHKYIKDAVNRGVSAAVVEEIQENIDIPQFQVKNSRAALARLGNIYYDYPSNKLKMTGITATNGKTTTSYMANAILEKAGLTTGLIGTVSIKNGNETIPSELTTPESLDLQYFLNEMVHNDVSHVTMEVSSSALELYRVAGVNYDIVTLNNISREHIDTHGSFENYFHYKSSLIRDASENSFAILNLDDDYSASLINKTNANVIAFGVNSAEGYIHCKNLDLSTGRAKYTFEILKTIRVNDDLVYKPFQFDVELGVPGLHSVYNSMVAIIIGLLNGVSISAIQQTLKEFKGVPRRFQFILESEFKIIDDHFANPGNIDVTMETVNFMDYKQLHLVYAIRGQRGPVTNRENAETIVKWASKLGLKEIIATKSVSHVTSKDEVSDEEVVSFLDVMTKAGIEVKLYDELPDAIQDGLEQAEKGDLVVLAGCQGMDEGAGIADELLTNLE